MEVTRQESRLACSIVTAIAGKKGETLLSLLGQTWAADIGLWPRVVNAWGFTKRQQAPRVYSRLVLYSRLVQ